MNKEERISEARRQAGKVSSPKKASASRENGKRGGRPGNPEIARIMEERGCSRQRAHQILKQRRAAV